MHFLKKVLIVSMVGQKYHALKILVVIVCDPE